ncbi:MAG: alpha/beta hydrolase domain-containing protein, partial [Actinomycetota bacterium]
VPIATYHGDEGCPLAGVSVALSASTLTTLYPTRARYVDALRAAADSAQAAGWLLGYDRSDLLARAAR